MPFAKEVIGMGVDAVSWSRIKRFLTHHSIEYVRRLLTPSEQRAFQTASHPVEFFGRCFAAKEAFFKASGKSWMGEEGFREIDIVMEKENRFHIRSGIKTEGRFFPLPDGMGAQVMMWRDALQ